MHASALPLASCIMPTADRPAFVPQAIACFLAQDFACRELIVLDNGRTPIAHLLPQADPRVHYQHIGPGYKLGALRNRACELARGEFIVHWDDDDWYAADRITRQVNCLQQTGAELCGSSHIHFLHASAPLAWLYAARGPRPWIAGSTLAYRRTLWERRPFDAVQVGEDSLFVAALPQDRVVDLVDPGLCIAAVHAGNTSPKSPMGMEWQPQDAALLRARVLGIAAPAPISAPDTAPVAAPAAHAPPEPPDTDFLRGRRICIGIHARDAAAGLQPTLQALAARTPAAVQRVVLSDTPGGAACFNRLLREHEADVHVLLECGAQVGPHWLQELLAALDADPRNGLAGPSTNRSWNRQGSLPLARADESGVSAQALALPIQFAGQWQTLTPLHCLADFCYAVKAELGLQAGLVGSTGLLEQRALLGVHGLGLGAELPGLKARQLERDALDLGVAPLDALRLRLDALALLADMFALQANVGQHLLGHSG